MLLKRWRIGSLSAALCLIAFGVLMLTQIFGGGVSGKLILGLWPIVMILLGLEVLAHLVFVRLEEGQKARYDVLGILFMGGILFASFIAYALSLYIGFFDSREAALSSVGFYTEYNTRSGETIFTGTERLVMQGGINEVDVRVGEGSDIRVTWELSVTGNSVQKAEEAMDGMLNIEKGTTGYLNANKNAVWRNSLLNNGYVDCVVYLPEGKSLDMRQYNGYYTYDNKVEAQIIKHQEPSYGWEEGSGDDYGDDEHGLSATPAPLPTSAPIDVGQDEDGTEEAVLQSGE